MRPKTPAIVAGLTAIALGFLSTGILVNPAAAADPFRTDNSRSIDNATEAAFEAMFEQGNYPAASQHLQQAESDEPMAYAMRASLAYLDQDLEAFLTNATQTREVAEQLTESDPVRGHLYTAVGHFLEGAYALKTAGTVKGTPQALGKLQKVFSNLKAAEDASPDDPELNLVKGYMDLMLAVNLPFSDPYEAIERLEDYAAPDYVAQRGIAVGYRDLDEQDEALEAIEKARQAAPGNPELDYLKAQILVRQGKSPESLEFFEKALEKQAQLPGGLVKQIRFEECRTEQRIENTGQSCGAVFQD